LTVVASLVGYPGRQPSRRSRWTKEGDRRLSLPKTEPGRTLADRGVDACYRPESWGPRQPGIFI
jgi:hypothetical protein